MELKVYAENVILSKAECVMWHNEESADIEMWSESERVRLLRRLENFKTLNINNEYQRRKNEKEQID